MAAELLEGMTEADLTALKRAVQLLEHPGLAVRLANVVGKPIELIGYALPAFVSQTVATATSKVLERALNVALRTMSVAPHAGSLHLHKALVTATGAAGGAFGIASLSIELPVSTTIMLRSIAEIARSEGEDLASSNAALACVQVFALGGRSGSVDASESGYFAVRDSRKERDGGRALHCRAQSRQRRQPNPRSLHSVSSLPLRSGSDRKGCSASRPGYRRAGRRCVNYVFVEHFQDIARGHFTVRRLERTYGKDCVRREYERLAARTR